MAVKGWALAVGPDARKIGSALVALLNAGQVARAGGWERDVAVFAVFGRGLAGAEERRTGWAHSRQCSSGKS